jgi:nucleoside diphosphate kinase
MSGAHQARAEPPPGELLSRVPGKLDWYAVDPYFRDACDDAREIAQRRGVGPDLWRHAFLVFRPDAVVTRSIGAGLRILDAAGFEVIGLLEFTYTHLTVREGWRYQLNIATRDRIDAMDLIMTATPSLMCLLRAAATNRNRPATALLNALKGPSAPEARRPGQLRSEMGPVQASVLTFVHTPDEPADLLRELAVFLPPEQRRRAMASLADRPPAISREQTDRHIEDLYGRTPVHDLTLALALQRLRMSADPAHSPLLHRLGAGEPSALQPTLAALRAADKAFSVLDAVAIAAHVGQRHITGMAPVLPDADPAAWDRGVDPQDLSAGR